MIFPGPPSGLALANTHSSTDSVRSVLVGVRGVYGKANNAWTAPLSSVSFNLRRRATKVRRKPGATSALKQI